MKIILELNNRKRGIQKAYQDENGKGKRNKLYQYVAIDLHFNVWTYKYRIGLPNNIAVFMTVKRIVSVNACVSRKCIFTPRLARYC